MKRKLLHRLAQWKDREDRKPLIIYGARQVGKSYLIQQFGKSHFQNIIAFNFETNETLCKFFEDAIQPHAILPYLELLSQEKIVAGESLIFFDEIQACPRALTSLKYFCEQAPQYHIIAAGSLLGVALKREQHSFPVGKVQEMQLYPMDFEEFLRAMGRELLVEKIAEHYLSNKPMEESLHQLCLDSYLNYSIIGGMPEAVKNYAKHKNYLQVQEIQHSILNAYIADMAKYANATTSIKIRDCFRSIPTQLAKDNSKFQYKVVKRGGSAALFGESIAWLCDAGICMKCTSAALAQVPLKAHYELSNFKLYMGDIGLLTQHSGTPISSILSPLEQGYNFMGALAENYVAQALKSNGYELAYWTSEGKAEVDYLIQAGNQVIPIEVKAGTNTQSRSLSVLMQRFHCDSAIRLSQKNFGVRNKVKEIPLYAAFCIKPDAEFP
ncbi:MAG: ATP-binding protein [Akkermansia sp.]